MYTFEEEKLIKEIKERKPRRILLQLPEGLKKEGLRLMQVIQEKTKTEVILSGEPCWGACDIAVTEAKSLQADLLVLYGHAPFMKIDFPIIYMEARFEKDLTKILEKALKEIKSYNNIGLICSVQHMHQLEKAKKLFEAQGKHVEIPMKKGHTFYDGQVLGCEYNPIKSIAKKVDVFLVIANKFHAVGAALAVPTKPVILLDPVNEEIVPMEHLKKKLMMQRFAAIEKAEKAKKFGIIIGLKPGQTFGSFDFVTQRLKKLEKEYVLITMGEITENKLVNLYDIEAFIELACPRIAIEDVARYSKPVLTLREFSVVAGDSSREDLMNHGFL